MQGIAGFFKSVIKPYAVSSPEDSNAPDTSNSLNEERSEKVASGPVNHHANPEDNHTEEMPLEKLRATMEHDECLNETRETIYDLIKDIRDPEKPNSLEELDVVSEDNISVCKFNKDSYLIQITFVPTVPHCSLASLIGLCLRQKLIQDFPEKHKLDIFVKDGTHETADEVNKQINDKERIAAALENPNLRELVDQCISNDFG